MASKDRTETAKTPGHGFGGYLLFGTLTVFVLVVCIGGWAAWASINGAVIAPATVVVETNAQAVQHAEGGIVEEILVREGDHVEAGAVLVRLDETETRANLAIVESQLVELLARHARLEAERDGLAEVVFPKELRPQPEDAVINRVTNGQEKLFAARRDSQAGEKGQLEARIGQLEKEVVGLQAQQVSKETQIEIVGRELTGLRKLKKDGLVQINRLLALEREAARLEGERGQLLADVARAEGRISETRLRIIQVDQDMRKEVLAELREAQTKIAELMERRVAARSRLRRTVITSPRTGFVLQVTVHTVGGVIKAGETVMLVVPEQDTLMLEARVDPQDIDQVKVGHDTIVRLSAFGQRTTPELNGKVVRVSADLMQEGTGETRYYGVRIMLPAIEMERLGERSLKPGMPAEAFIQTGARSALSYLLRPLSDQVMRAFREE